MDNLLTFIYILHMVTTYKAAVKSEILSKINAQQLTVIRGVKVLLEKLMGMYALWKN